MESTNKRYEVVESKYWKNTRTGATASLTGACPYWGDPSGWEIASRGWTVRDNKTNTVGVGRTPWKTREEAQSFVDQCS